jgi:hypothetical protein
MNHAPRVGIGHRIGHLNNKVRNRVGIKATIWSNRKRLLQILRNPVIAGN